MEESGVKTSQPRGLSLHFGICVFRDARILFHKPAHSRHSRVLTPLWRPAPRNPRRQVTRTHCKDVCDLPAP